MIQRSRRQRAADRSDAEVFALHTRMASRSAWHRRLVRASLGSLLASVVTVALGWSPWQQVAGLAVGFLAGLLLPVRGHVARALERIRRQAGLSYETALERDAAPDPFGLTAEVRQRARLTTRDVRAPEHPPWWLPALAAAVALLLLPAAATRDAAARAAPEPPPVSAEPLPLEPTVEDAPTAPAPPAPAPDRARSAPSDADPARAADQPSSQAPGAAPSEQETLARYLEELRERPAGEQRGEGAEAPPTVAPREGGAAVPGRQQDEARAEAQPADAGQGAGEDRAEGGDPEGGPAGEEAEQGDGAPDEGEGEEGQAEPEAGEGEPQEGAGMPAQADGAEGEREPGQAGQGLEPGEGGLQESDAAGNQAGAPAPPGVPAPAPGTPPQFLQGVLGAGPETPGGTLRLPGSTDVELPPGTSVGSYRRAAEQALTEGDVPLEYQEVIRRYFR